MITNLEILNGSLTIPYDLYVDKYTVKVDEQTDFLDINYSLSSDDVAIDIIGNESLNNNSVITINASDGINNEVIELTIIKESQSVSKLDQYLTKVEVNNTIPYNIVPPLIGVVVFMIILVLYTILFKKKKN